MAATTKLTKIGNPTGAIPGDILDVAPMARGNDVIPPVVAGNIEIAKPLDH